MTSFRAFRAITDGTDIDRQVITMSPDDLPQDGVLIKVEWSSVNYKDGLASTPTGRVARISPLVPGIDLAGVVVDGTPELPAGTAVLAHGGPIGVARHGGFAEYARVPSDLVVRVPESLTTREVMVIGTAGFTAAASVVALENHGITPEHGPVLVTGATGGVGSIAVDLLAQRGYEVIASTGKPDAGDWLRDLGAAQVVDRGDLIEEGRRPLEAPQFAAAVDCVGGITLANILKRLEYGGAVAASGLTGGSGLTTTVLPFILRKVSLLGVDSVELAPQERRSVWDRIGSDLTPSHRDSIGTEIGLDELDATLTGILAGQARGRSVLNLGG